MATLSLTYANSTPHTAAFSFVATGAETAALTLAQLISSGLPKGPLRTALAKLTSTNWSGAIPSARIRVTVEGTEGAACTGMKLTGGASGGVGALIANADAAGTAYFVVTLAHSASR